MEGLVWSCGLRRKREVHLLPLPIIISSQIASLCIYMHRVLTCLGESFASTCIAKWEADGC